MLTNRKYSGRRPLVVVAALLSLMILLPLAGCKTEVDSVDPPARYTVKFDRGDNSEYAAELPSDITVDSGTKLTAEQLESLDSTADYTFEGWYDGETKAVGGEYTVTKDVTLVAKWKSHEKVKIKLTVSGNTVELASDPAGATIHYTTDGTDPKTSGTSQTGTSVSITQETTIKAYAERVGELKESDVAEKTYYVVTFDANGGSEVASQPVESGKVAKKPEDPTKADHAFVGWYSDKEGNSPYTFEDAVTQDITLYAKWAVASVRTAGDAITPYDNFDAALNAAMNSTGSTLTLLADINRSSRINIDKGDFTLDLNGKAIISSVATFIYTSGIANLTISASGATGKISGDGTVHSSNTYGVYHGSTGTLTIEGKVEITGADASGNNGAFGVYNSTSGTVMIKNYQEDSYRPSITAGKSEEAQSVGVQNYNDGSVTIKAADAIGGAAGAWSVGVSNNSTGTVTISGSSPLLKGGTSGDNMSYGVWAYGDAPINLEGSSMKVAGESAGFRVNSTNSNAYLSLSKECDFSSIPTVLVASEIARTGAVGVFAKPGVGAALKAEWFSPASSYTNHTVQLTTDGNLEIVENTN